MVFRHVADNFLKNLEALQLFLSAQDKLGKAYRNKDVWDIEELEEIQSGDKGKIIETIEFLFNSVIDIPNTEDVTEEYLEELKVKADGLAISFVENSGEEKGVKFTINDEVVGKIFKNTIEKGDLNFRQEEMVRRTALTSLMVYFESLIASVIRQRLKNNPNAFNPDDKSIKYSELKDFDSFDDALDHLMELEVTNIMFGGLKSWIIYLKKAGLDLTEIDSYTEMINEIHNRRNLYVHNDGVVNSIYLNKVDKKYIENVSKGKQIDITETYLEEAIEATKIYGTLILIESWRKFKKEKINEINDFAETTGFKSMQKKEWEFARYLYKFLLRESDSYADQVRTSLNLWLCEKMQGNFEKVKSDIEKCDVKGMKSEYQLCKYALLEMNDQFFSLLKKDAGMITEEELKTWPVFYSIREDSRINEYLT